MRVKTYNLLFLLLPIALYAQPEFVFQLYGGYSWHQTGNTDISLPPYEYQITDVMWNSESFIAPQFYIFATGYMIDREKFPLRICFEYIHDKVLAATDKSVYIAMSNDPELPAGQEIPLKNLLDQYTMTYGFNHLVLKAAFPLWQPRLWNKTMRIFAGIGVGMISTYVASARSDQYRGQFEWHGPSLIADLIVEFPVTNMFTLNLGGKYLSGRVDEAGIISDGKLSVTIHTWQAILGAGFVLK